jgi:hypothetical protein
MGNYEDFFWEVKEILNQQGLNEEFNKQLQKMQFQDKHKHKTVRESWAYALARVTGSVLPGDQNGGIRF